MTTPIVYIDRSDIREGKLEEVRAAIRALVDLVEPREPQLVAYDFYVDEAAREQTVVAVHPDAGSLELHLAVGAPGFRRFDGLIDLRSIDVYGDPGATVREQLRRKAAMLGATARVTIHERFAGIVRDATPRSPRPRLG